MADTIFKRNGNGGVNGYPSGIFYEESAPEVQAHLAAGGIIEPERSPEEELAQLQVQFTAALQRHLDAVARTRGYDGILSLCSYASSPHPRFGPEGKAGLAWRDEVWAAGYQVMADVQAGRRGVPTAEQLVAEMPEMVWP